MKCPTCKARVKYVGALQRFQDVKLQEDDEDGEESVKSEKKGGVKGEKQQPKSMQKGKRKRDSEKQDEAATPKISLSAADLKLIEKGRSLGLKSKLEVLLEELRDLVSQKINTGSKPYLQKYFLV